MSAHDDLKDFLTTRRGRITPRQAGLPNASSPNRRVPGLRREEVAILANISVEYYTRIERGNATGVSDAVLAAIADALQLDEAERAHLHELARTINRDRPTPRRRTRRQQVRPAVQRIVDAISDTPAYVSNSRSDILTTNPLARALFAPLFASTTRPVNAARFVFLDPASHDFWPDWDKAANDSVASLRAAAGRDPYDRHLSDLIGELSTRSDEFRTRWAAHDVRLHRTGTKRLHHPDVGEMVLSFEVLDVVADQDQRLVVFTAEANTPAHDSLQLLTSLLATPTDRPHEHTTQTENPAHDDDRH